MSINNTSVYKATDRIRWLGHIIRMSISRKKFHLHRIGKPSRRPWLENVEGHSYGENKFEKPCRSNGLPGTVKSRS